MNFFSSPGFRLILFYLILVGFACSPIWAVEYFINHDGSAHLYSGYLMLELLKGNPSVTEIYALNSITVPNSSGHWLLVLLLSFFSPFLVTKIIVTLTFSVFVAAVGWLRWQTAGAEGLKTSLLIGAAMGFNFLWFVGFYNFIIGACLFVVTLGLYYVWREKLNAWRALILALLLLLTYFSHIVSFAILAGSILFLAFFSPKTRLKKTLALTILAILPVLPVFLYYRTLGIAGGSFSPVWRNLANPFSIMSWLSQIRTADPFIIISRKTLPFVDAESNLFFIFAPLLWLGAAFFLLTAATWRKSEDNKWKNRLPFVILLFGSILTAMFAPDDFGLTNGSILRERVLLCGLIFFIPLFRVETSGWLKRLAQISLGFVIVFQTAALWEFSLQTNREAQDYFSVSAMITEKDSVFPVVLSGESRRFHSLPTTGMGNYLGIGRNIQVWNDYEIGHRLFPIVAKNEADRQFMFDFPSAAVNLSNNSEESLDEKLSKLDSALAANHGKIKILLIWDSDPAVEAVFAKWFETEPFFTNGRVRLFRHK
jgi:hypothetical protein